MLIRSHLCWKKKLKLKLELNSREKRYIKRLKYETLGYEKLVPLELAYVSKQYTFDSFTSRCNVNGLHIISRCNVNGDHFA